jgi:hypothetical protein
MSRIFRRGQSVFRRGQSLRARLDSDRGLGGDSVAKPERADANAMPIPRAGFPSQGPALSEFDLRRERAAGPQSWKAMR